MFDLTQKNIILTGSEGLLGTEFKKMLIQSNSRIIGLDIKKISTNFKDNKNKYNYIKCDLSNNKDIKNLPRALTKLGINNIHGIINNASINPKVEKKNKNFSSLQSFKENDLLNEIRIGVIAPIKLINVLENNFFKEKVSIVNIASDLALIAPNHSIYNSKSQKNYNNFKPISYSIVKTALLGFTRYMATYNTKKIRCNAICPAGVENNQSKVFIKKISNLIPMNRMAKSYEFNGLVNYLLSDSSGYLNGAIIPIDGGRICW